MILVTGTGRCGTLSVARLLQSAGLDVRHEPGAPYTMLPSAMWPQGMDDLTAIGWLSMVDWGQGANVFWRYATMLPLLETMWPGSQWVWVHRRADATVASMLARGWWRPSDDEAWPALVIRPDGSTARVEKAGRCRPNGYTLGDMEYAEWRSLPQIGRCAWWWGKVHEIMSAWRCIRFPIEANPGLLMDALGLPWDGRHWQMNRSDSVPDLPGCARLWIDRYCAEGMDGLYG